MSRQNGEWLLYKVGQPQRLCCWHCASTLPLVLYTGRHVHTPSPCLVHRSSRAQPFPCLVHRSSRAQPFPCLVHRSARAHPFPLSCTQVVTCTTLPLVLYTGRHVHNPSPCLVHRSSRAHPFPLSCTQVVRCTPLPLVLYTGRHVHNPRQPPVTEC